MVQLVHDGYKQVNVLESFAGTERGGHFHKKATEVFFVVNGSVNVNMRKDNIKLCRSFSKGDLFAIKPGTLHSLYFETDCIMVALYDVPIEGEDGTKDIFTGG